MKYLSLLITFFCFFSYSQNFDKRIDELIQENIEETIELRHWVHQNAELSNREFKTAERVAQELRKMGYNPKTGIAKTGVVAILNEGKAGPVVGLRADIDGLPVKERADIPWASKMTGIYNGEEVPVMHACGHDGHMAMLLGAAYKLSKNANFSGTIVFIFQPNEELGLGAKAMMDEGLLENFPIQEIYGIHNLPGVPTGELLTRSGVICSSESLFEIKIKGMGGHSSMPQLGRDAITIGSEVVQALQTIISRRIGPGSGAVVSVTEFISNGQRNVLPGETILKGDVRTRRPDDRKKIEELYNLEIDIGETNNLAKKFPEKVDELKELMLKIEKVK